VDEVVEEDEAEGEVRLASTALLALLTSTVMLPSLPPLLPIQTALLPPPSSPLLLLPEFGANLSQIRLLLNLPKLTENRLLLRPLLPGPTPHRKVELLLRFRLPQLPEEKIRTSSRRKLRRENLN
jgi:hypothetical protein